MILKIKLDLWQWCKVEDQVYTKEPNNEDHCEVSTPTMKISIFFSMESFGGRLVAFGSLLLSFGGQK